MRKLSPACTIVKVFWLTFAIHSVASEAHQVTPYGPYIIENSLIWLPNYLDVEATHRSDFIADKLSPDKQAELELVRAFQRAAYEIRKSAYRFIQTPLGNRMTVKSQSKNLVRFREGKDPIFNLIPSEPARTAVTTSKLKDPVTFNLALISDPLRFT